MFKLKISVEQPNNNNDNNVNVPPRRLSGFGTDNLVLFPKSIALYSLKLDHDRRQLMAVELNEWLQTMVTKHQTKVENSFKMKDLVWLNRVQNQEKVFNLTPNDPRKTFPSVLFVSN